MPDADFCGPAYKWHAIILIGESLIMKESIDRAAEIKELMSKAVELDPTDSMAWHVLGLWHFYFAGFPRKVKQKNKQIPEGSFDQALKCFLEAEKHEPKASASNLLMLAYGYRAVKVKGNDKKYLKMAAAFQNPMTRSDKNAVRIAKIELDKLNMEKKGKCC